MLLFYVFFSEQLIEFSITVLPDRLYNKLYAQRGKALSKQDFKNMFTNKSIAYAGIFYAFSEFFVIYVSINILPVSIVAVFLRLSVPAVMVYSAIKYKEQSLKNQLSFALIAILLVLPIILIKG